MLSQGNVALWNLYRTFSDGISKNTDTDNNMNETTEKSLHERLDALSENSKEWLDATCERFADDEGYTMDAVAIKECEEAGLIQKRRNYINIEGDVMKAVYSEDYIKPKT